MHSSAYIVIANEPRSYREALAGAFRGLRPGAEISLVEPEGLDVEVRRLSPALVICSCVTPVVEEFVPVWVELYPEGGREVRISVQGSLLDYTLGVGLPELLSIADRSERLARMG